MADYADANPPYDIESSRMSVVMDSGFVAPRRPGMTSERAGPIACPFTLARRSLPRAVRWRDREHLVGAAVAAVGHFLDQHHRMRPGGLAKVIDEHRRDAMDDLLLLGLAECSLGNFDVGERHQSSCLLSWMRAAWPAGAGGAVSDDAAIDAQDLAIDPAGGGACEEGDGRGDF